MKNFCRFLFEVYVVAPTQAALWLWRKVTR